MEAVVFESARSQALSRWRLAGPPKALEAPKPTSSNKMMSTFGAPGGGRIGSIGGNLVSGSLASYVVDPTKVRSGIGRTDLACLSGRFDITYRFFRNDSIGPL